MTPSVQKKDGRKGASKQKAAIHCTASARPMLRPFSCFASCILLVSSPYDTPRRVSPLLLSDGRNKATEKSWCSQEDWALLDGVSSFTVGEGKFKATFWDALAASNVVLRERTPTECAKRIKALSPKARSGGGQPKRLDVWRRLPDGRYMGIDNGRVLHITVSEEGHLAEGTQPHYIESTMGRVYELAPTSDFLAGLVDDEPPPETKLGPTITNTFVGRPGARDATAMSRMLSQGRELKAIPAGRVGGHLKYSKQSNYTKTSKKY